MLAGGTGSRMGRPKQFIELLGEPALLHTLRAFEKAAGIARIYTVGNVGHVEALASKAGISKYAGCAEPGEARSDSTMSGLGLMRREPESTVVLIQDGSRCLVTEELIERVVDASTPETGGVVPALPVSDTVKSVRDGVVHETLDRSNLWAVQTPQAFRLGPLRGAYGASGEEIARATDDASLIENFGGEVRVIEGEKTNIKLTSPEDLVFARAILQTRLAGAAETER